MRLRQICFVANDLESALSELTFIFNTEICFRDPGVGHFGLSNGLLEVGGDFIEVVSPKEEDTTAGRFLDKMGGDSSYMLIFQCQNALEYREKAKELQIREIWKSDLENGVHATHFHPKDIGGVIMSIDSMNIPNWQDRYSYWQWSGNDWMNNEHNNQYLIKGVTLNCLNPKSLSQKWSEFLNLPVSQKSKNYEIEGDGFKLVFAENSAKGLDYMAELDVHIFNDVYKDKITKHYEDEDIIICGTKININ